METKILLQNDSLWNRLQSFSLDTPNVDFPFSKKLAKEENWTLDFTAKAIEEYKNSFISVVLYQTELHQAKLSIKSGTCI
ncbi:hypothetical protein [Chryseobacterium sp. 3008163]|uniref:hypothetical protein n=1 Tax=Chryseobacterium sp. 3008163 TaxID=2478663 RepID=UPI001E647F0B|nr:hypothetical protein [Chryseobacterium sp. 3008163]